MPTVDENFIKRIQPHSEEAERSVLGSMLMDRDAIVEAEDILTKEDFYQRQYGIVFEAMVELYREGKAVDLITLQNKLKEKEVPEEFINVEYNEIIVALKRYEMLYSKDSIDYMSKENLDKIKDITYIIALMVRNKIFYLSNKVSRDKLIQLYNDCKNRENQYKGTDNQIENFINYYYKSVENELTKEVTKPSFFMPDNSEIEI